MSEDAREMVRVALLQVAPESAGLLVRLTPDASLDDLGLDWISGMEVVAVLEKMLKTRFDDGELAEIHTLADLLLLVERRQAVRQ
jgi:acyl carrier protein